MRWWQQSKNLYHWVEAQGWRTWYGFPDKGLTLWGVTGTNGKTTTCHVVAAILQAEYGVDRVGMLTTIAFWFGKKKIVNSTKLTTLPSRIVYSYLAQMKKQGVQQVVLELTSHALDQHRVAGIHLSGAIILNITREHLDYHRTIDEYAQAKARLLTYLPLGTGILVGKSDDPRVAAILAGARQRGLKVVGFTREEALSVSTSLPGDFNKENVWAATLLAQAAGISAAAIQKGIAAVEQVPGRMEWIKSSAGFRVLIDYAVTPDSLSQLYSYVKKNTEGKILALLGATGRRDRGKRAQMSKVVSRFADEIVLTREDPWDESEEQIFSDLEAGLVGVNIFWCRITDRRRALEYVLRKAQADDVVVVTGKGAETGMALGEKIIPWQERKVVQEIIEQLGQRVV